MYKGHTVAVVVPAYNEEGFVGEVIETVPEFVDRVYAIDDRSTDGTWEEIERTAARVNREEVEAMADGGTEAPRRVVPIRHEENRGVGGAVKTGYARARDDGMDVVALMNGDGQMDPDILDRIIEPVVSGEADYAKGNRLLHPDDRRSMPGFRFFGNAIISFLSKFSSGYWKITDPLNGYTAISGDALERLDLDALYDEYGFLNHLLVHLNTHRMRVADVAMEAVYGEETSSIRYSRFVPTYSWLLLRSFLWRLKVRYLVYDFHPLVLFYLAGVVGLAGGVAGALGTGYLLVAHGTGLAAFLASVVALVAGTVALAGGMMLDMYESEDLEVRRYEYSRGGSAGSAGPLGSDE